MQIHILFFFAFLHHSSLFFRKRGKSWFNTQESTSIHFSLLFFLVGFLFSVQFAFRYDFVFLDLLVVLQLNLHSTLHHTQSLLVFGVESRWFEQSIGRKSGRKRTDFTFRSIGKEEEEIRIYFSPLMTDYLTYKKYKNKTKLAYIQPSCFRDPPAKAGSEGLHP